MAGKTNIELLTRDPDRIDPFLSKWWNPLAGTFVGVVTAAVLKFGLRRPLLSGMYVLINVLYYSSINVCIN